MAERQHAVSFYADDLAHIPVVSGFLAEALRRGGSVGAIATTDHLEKIRSHIGAEFDVVDLVSCGRFAEFDAEQIADRLSGGEISLANLARILPLDVLTLSSAGSAHVYGEIVAVLWRLGQVAEALAVEAAWNELIDAHGFGLLCGYPADQIGAHQREDIRRVCAEHSERWGIEILEFAFVVEVSQSLAGEGRAPRQARQLIADHLAGLVEDRLLEDALVVATELVSNVVRHARTSMEVSLSLTLDGIVRIAVIDEAPPFIASLAVPAGEFRSGGRGLVLVDALSVRWGVDVLPHGKAMWAELASTDCDDLGRLRTR
jgi:anti-sigma regulatory factor (Ser/Thr protein kinase)